MGLGHVLQLYAPSKPNSTFIQLNALIYKQKPRGNWFWSNIIFYRIRVSFSQRAVAAQVKGNSRLREEGWPLVASLLPSPRSHRVLIVYLMPLTSLSHAFLPFLLVCCSFVASACLVHSVGAALGEFTQTLPLQIVLCALPISSASTLLPTVHYRVFSRVLVAMSF